LQDVRHYSKLDVEIAEGIARFGGLKRFGLKHGDTGLRCSSVQGIRSGAFFLGGTKDAGNRIAPRRERLQGGFPKVLLANDRDSSHIVALLHWRGTGRAEPGSSHAGKKRGFCRLRLCDGAALAARSPGPLTPALVSSTRHWPRGAGVLSRRQKAWFLPAALVQWRGTGRAQAGGFCRLHRKGVPPSAHPALQGRCAALIICTRADISYMFGEGCN
jgi:hypothetical protein